MRRTDSSALRAALCSLTIFSATEVLAGDMPVYYDFVENGVLRGGKVVFETNNADHRRIFGLDLPPGAPRGTWSSTTVVNNGPTSNRVDLVILGDGYIAGELGLYAAHTTNIVGSFFAEDPLGAYSTYFNVHRVDVVSAESGVDEPVLGIFKDTALDMEYDCAGIDRLLCISVSKAILAAGSAPAFDQIIALANSSRYGGAGYPGNNLGTVAGANASAVEIALHEFGHAFADLADEYDYGDGATYSGPEPIETNISVYDAAEQVAQQRKWWRWMDLGNVHTFEGAAYNEFGIYRPTFDSKMRSLGPPFEQVNVEQFVLSLYETVNPIDAASAPSGTPLPPDTTFFVTPLQPVDHALDIQWSVDGSPVAGATGTTFTPQTDLPVLELGVHTLTVTVVDDTPRVRDEGLRASMMTETRMWSFQVVGFCSPAMLTASDAGVDDHFGWSVSVSGDVAIVGAGSDDCADGDYCGSAYVYRLDGSTWIEQAKLTDPDASHDDVFGRSVSVNGEVAIVGVFLDDCMAGTNCGSVYVYRSNGSNWVEEQKLNASDAQAEDKFGYSVSISGDTVVVGAGSSDCMTGSDCGSAYVYRFDGSTWAEEAKLTASDQTSDDRFGQAVSVSGNVTVVGAYLDDCATGANCGSAYVYRSNGSAWVQEQKLSASDAGTDDHFGYSVAVNGNVAVIGAGSSDCAAGNYCGSGYVYRFNGSSWIEEAKLTDSEAAQGDVFGRSVSVSGDVVVIGAGGDDCTAGGDCGSAHVFRFNGTTWFEQYELTASQQGQQDEFGFSVSISGDVVAIGALLEDGTGGVDCGSAYVFGLGVNPPAIAPAPHNARKNRYISFAPNNGSTSVAFKVTRTDSGVPSAQDLGWVGVPDADGIARIEPLATPIDPVRRVWSEAVVHVGACAIIPVAGYEIRTSCDGVLFTSALPVETIEQPVPKFWGDTVDDFNGLVWIPPNRVVNVSDFFAAVKKFQGDALAPHLTWVDMEPACPNKVLNFTDIFQIVKGFQGEGYPFPSDPGACGPCP